jgi:flagellar basal body rod protein FlgB
MNDPVSSLIVRQMDIAAARHRVLAHKLANFGTPGAVAKGASFEGTLGKAVAGKLPQGGARPDPASAPTEAAAAAAKQAMPGVVLEGDSLAGAPAPMDTAEGFEMQMARLADNTGRFSALARILTIREKAYENAIRGR